MPNTPPTRSDVADLAAEVRSLAKAVRDRDRHFKAAIVIGLFALLLALGLALHARSQSQDAKEQSTAVEKQAAAVEELAIKQDLDRCRGANGARRAAYDGFQAFAGALIQATTPEDPEQMERFERTVAEFREGLAEGLVGLEPGDCDGDGVVTEDDFPPS